MGLWWGWVPILSHQVLNCRPQQQRFEKKTLNAAQADALDDAFGNIDRTTKYWIREDEIESDDTKFTRFQKIKRFCSSKKSGDAIATVVLSQEKIPTPKYVIARSISDENRKFFLAEIKVFNPNTGMFNFEVKTTYRSVLLEWSVAPKWWSVPRRWIAAPKWIAAPDWVAVQVFRIIRDVYHRHIWTRSGDVGIFPVRASSTREAAEKIWDEGYGERIIINRHHDVNERLKGLHFGSTSRTWLDAFRVCSTGLGELSYAKAMAHLTGIDSKRISAVEWSTSSFQNLFALLEKEQTIRRDHGVTFLVFTVLGTLSGSYYIISKVLEGLLPSDYISTSLSAWLAIFVTVICLGIIYSCKARNLGKSKSILSHNHY